MENCRGRLQDWIDRLGKLRKFVIIMQASFNSRSCADFVELVKGKWMNNNGGRGEDGKLRLQDSGERGG